VTQRKPLELGAVGGATEDTFRSGPESR
jgi:hypothetical protein